MSVIIFILGVAWLAVVLVSESAMDLASSHEQNMEFNRVMAKYTKFIPKKHEEDEAFRQMFKAMESNEIVEMLLDEYEEELSYIFGENFRDYRTGIYKRSLFYHLRNLMLIRKYKMFPHKELLIAGFSNPHRMNGYKDPLHLYKALQMYAKLMREIGAEDVCFVPVMTSAFRSSLKIMRECRVYDPDMLPPHGNCGFVNLGVTRFEGSLEEAKKSHVFRERYEVKDYEKWITVIQNHNEEILKQNPYAFHNF